jgi:hypothetical protein
MITNETILEILKNQGISLESLANEPKILEKACNTVYKVMPIPMRMLIGKKKVNDLIVSLAANISRSSKSSLV